MRRRPRMNRQVPRAILPRPIGGRDRHRAPWGCSSAGRALRSHRRGQGFESPHLHHSSDVRPADSFAAEAAAAAQAAGSSAAEAAAAAAARACVGDSTPSWVSIVRSIFLKAGREVRDPSRLPRGGEGQHDRLVVGARRGDGRGGRARVIEDVEEDAEPHVRLEIRRAQRALGGGHVAQPVSRA